MHSSEQSFQAFEKIILDQSQYDLATQTEADTRARLISRILRDALNWPDANISREEHARPGYMDYVLSLQRRMIVVEAKKSGDTFQLPPDISTSATFTLMGIIRTIKNLTQYIAQVTNYCFNNGIEYAVVSNGLQWVIFRAVRTDGIHVGQGRVIVFKSLEDIRDRFVEFWALLSKSSVENNSLARTFQPSEAAAFQYKRLVDEIHTYQEKVTRNTLSPDLEPLIREYMGEIADDASREKLRDLFVKSQALTEVLNAVEHRLNIVLSNTLIHTQGIRVSRKPDDLRSAVKQKIASHFKLPPRGEVILLLGRVGSGKTTFVNHFLRIDLKETFKDHFVVLLDFRLFEKGDDIRRFFYTNLRRVLAKNELFAKLSSKHLRQVYATEIRELSIGPLAALERVNKKKFEEKIAEFLMDKYNDIEQYFPSVLRYLADRQNVRCVFVLDNVDQLDSALQQEIFTFAHSLSGNTHSLTLLTMWEETYLNSKRGGALAVYQTMAYALPPTSVVDIIDRRLQYILENLKGNGTARLLLPDESLLEDLKDFLSLVRQSLLHNKKRVRFFLESISMGNLRKAMEIFSSFLTSGHTDSGKMVSIFRQEERTYDIPLHEFVKSIALGDQKYYQSNLSSVLNLYSISDESRPSHFTKLRLLEYLYFHRTRSSFAFGMGFIPTSTLKAEFEKIGTSETDILESLKVLTSMQLLENDIYDFKKVGGAYRITPAGRYYIRYLGGRFAYLDLVLQDTPISDDSTFRTIKDLISSRELDDRFERVRVFLNYLKTEEEREYQVIGDVSDSLPLRKKLMSSRITEFEADRTYVLHRVQERREQFRGVATPPTPYVSKDHAGR